MTFANAFYIETIFEIASSNNLNTLVEIACSQDELSPN